MPLEILRHWIGQHIIGQKYLVDRLLIALLADGHLLVEGAPGLAKTKAIKQMALGIEGNFQRIQFTPDLLPSDVTGTDIYRPQEHRFEFQPGPIFHNLVLADEINRAPAKVQSALLEAMAERQVSVGNKTYTLPDLFLVMATQNPIEQEGTYPLPEAQLDRFLMKVNVEYPNAETESGILRLARSEANNNKKLIPKPISKDTLFKARQAVLNVHTAENLDNYMVQLTMATREPLKVSVQFAQWIEYGVSPRATIALDRCAKAHAFLNGQDYLTPDNIHAVLFDVFRHRLLLSFEAEAQGITAEKAIAHLIDRIAVV